MEVSRTWVMPSIWTFTMKPIKKLFEKYNVGKNWVDPFAGENSPAEIANDIEGRGNTYQMDALEFLKTLETKSFDGVLFDPPYSVEQCLRRYTPKHNGTAGRAEYWAKCKDEIARILKPNGLCISFCWDSVGLGKNRKAEIIEVMLLCHGACHNDTIITVDKKKE
jgi:DNA modification methylase